MSRSTPRSRELLALAAACALACCVPAAPAAAQATGRYVDASAYARTPELVDAWYGMTWQLGRDFDWICGDTFCEGEFTNIQALRYQCSVHESSGRIGMCVWSFAASDEYVEPNGGRIAVTLPTWECRTPLSPGTTFEALLEAVEGQSPLYAPLPGSMDSIYDGLVDCL